MTPRELIEKWRDESDRWYKEGNGTKSSYRVGCGDIGHKHANELEEAWEALLQVLDVYTRKEEMNFILDFHISYFLRNGQVSIEEIHRYVRRLEALIKKYNSFADLYYEHGLAFALMSSVIHQKAVKSLGQAVRINPEFKQARKQLQHLHSMKFLTP